jgi:drug/metabolite transporter (DMT)-like permease
MFIAIFNLMGISSQKAGVSVTSVANKMSVVLPVVFGFIFLSEGVTGLKIVGIFLAMVALYFTTLRSDKDKKAYLIIFPIIIFFASGVLDIILGYCSKTLVDPGDTIVFTACLFSIAAILGFIWLLFLLIAGKQKIKGKNIVAGIVLGIPNFGSILFVFEGLKATQWDVSVFYPVLNMGVVVLASLLGWIFYKEKLSPINMAGILLAAISIYLISF